LREGQGVVLQAGERHQLAHPVRVEGELRGVVALELEARGEGGARAAMRELQWGAGWLEVLLRRFADPVVAARERLGMVLHLVAGFVEGHAYRDAATALVTELASRLGCDRVVLASLERGELYIDAVSHATQFDRQANLLGATRR